MRSLVAASSCAVVCLLLAGRAAAGGFDTPILYSARHMGMGGAAIGYVDEPSAMFHNPAGLSGVSGLELTLNLSPIVGEITTSPGDDGNPAEMADAEGRYPTRTTELIFAPAFLLGAGYRLSEHLVLGFGVFPVASASGEYRTTGRDFSTGRDRARINQTQLTFIEATPGLSLELPGRVSLGAGYRITLAQLKRVQGWEDDPNTFDFEVSGIDLTGVRVGLQWRVSDALSLGAVYRHRVEPTLTADSGLAVGAVENLETSLVLPSKLGVGARADLGALGLALDLEYGFYSQNERTELRGCRSDLAAQAGARSCTLRGQAQKLEVVDNVFEWDDAVTVRAGVEYTLREHFPVRAGYVFDGKVSNEHYPSAFGTPPAASHSVTVGAGYRAERFQLNVASALRTASTSITRADTGDGETPDPYPCATCSKAGSNYSLWLLGMYVDFSYDFDVGPLF